jgi:hypothetical protein
MGFVNGRLVRVVMKATKGLDTQVNVLHYDVQNTLGDSSMQTLADFFRDNVLTPFRVLYDNTWTIQPVVVEDEIDPLNPTAPRSAWTSGAAAVGSSVAAGDLLPRACCVVVTLRSDHIGRRFTGRMFVSGITNEAKQNAGVWDPSWLGLVNAYVAAIPRNPDVFQAPANDGNCYWSVFSRTQRAANLNPYAAAITSTQTRDRVHWLRSRQEQ